MQLAHSVDLGELAGLLCLDLHVELDLLPMRLFNQICDLCC